MVILEEFPRGLVNDKKTMNEHSEKAGNQLPYWLKEHYPFDSHCFETGSEQRLHYVDEGNGVPLVMLHGNPTWSFFYRKPVLAFREKYRCLALDHLGCGLSDKPADASYRLDAHIKRTIAWLDQLGLDSINLVVHDWGGAIGFGVARRIPERIRSITIFNTAAFPSPRIPKRIALCRFPFLGQLLVQGLNAFALAATRMTTVHPLSPEIRKAYLYPYRTWADRKAVYRFVRDIPMHSKHPSYPELEAIKLALPQFRKKNIQICWGGKDWCFNRSFYERFLEVFPEARYEFFPAAGHYLLEDEGPNIISLMDGFLKDS